MKFGSHHYRPLIDGLTISESSINGLGLHATKDLRAGVFLGETHIWETTRHDWIRTPLGGFINHSNSPNCFIYLNYHRGDVGDCRELYTTKPIKVGEELTVFYTVGYDDIEEYE